MSNRAIQFRAWDKENKKMQWPCEISIGDLQGSPIHRTFEHGSIETCPPNPSVIEDYELMQFTGLLDKNGVPIYEGDIVTTGDGDAKWLFVWYKCGFYLHRYTTKGRDNEDDNTATVYGATPERNWYIIGNIYENPDLV